MSEHKYILEPYNGMKTRYRCPKCLKPEKTFALYIDTETKEHLNDNVGRCNRETSCGYHYGPKQYFQDNNIEPEKRTAYDFKKPIPVKEKKQTSYIDKSIFIKSLSKYDNNHFITYLINLFGETITSELIKKYYIGTSNKWNGSTVFWQVGLNGMIRTGKIMLYNPSNGKRVKEPFNHIQWAHKLLAETNFSLNQCLFGEHLLKDKNKPVSIVESEKTAIIASVYLPQFIWVAVGSLTNLTDERCEVLKGRNVTLFPDLKGFDKWSEKANELKSIASFKVSDLLERKANEKEREQGLDLADYLIRFKIEEFIKPIEQPEYDLPFSFNLPTPEHYIKVLDKPKVLKEKYSKSWNKEIEDLENYFNTNKIPDGPINLKQGSIILDGPKFIDSHLSTVQANNGNRTFLPHLIRLQELKQILSTIYKY